MKDMSGRISRIAAAGLLSLAGVVSAATPLVIPAGPGERWAKSTDAPVRFNRDGLERLSPGGEVELTLPDGSRHEYVYEHSVSHGGGFTTWIARSPLTGDNERAIITYGPHGAWGWMKTAFGDFRIYPSGKGYDLLAKREPASLAPKFRGSDAVPVAEDDPRLAPLKGVPTVVDGMPRPGVAIKALKVVPSPVLQSDVMFIYTRDLAEKLGVGLMPMLYNLIASANTAYADSHIAVTVRLVNATMIDYANGDSPSSNGSRETLIAMAGSGANAAIFQPLTWGVGSLRDTVGADFVALLRDGPTDTGGIGNLPKNPVTYPVSTVTSSTAYSVNNYCASGCEGIVVHEIGHNMGSHHDPGTIAKDSGNGTVDETGVFAYSYGYYSCAAGLTCNPYTPGGCPSGYAACAGNNDNDFGTIMSYVTPKLMKFSNPTLADCVPAGGNAATPRACGGSFPAPAPALTSDNALSINNVRGAISAYRTQTIANLPGSLQFTNTAYSGAEGANLTFTVSRASGSSGAVSVNYTVTAGSATAGTDFTVANGTLAWASGDSANKSFNVALSADAAVEGIESFTATLSSPSGATGVYLGYPTTATGLILEAWPVGTLGGIPTDPPGWTSPASPISSVPWSIVNDSAPAGDPGGTSLKSGQIDFSVANRLCNDSAYGAIPCPSAIELTRNFVAGTVAYAYRVSAFPNNGFLEFLVDGVLKGTDTTSPYSMTLDSTTLSNGTHTLTATAADAAGNTATSAPVSFSISNTVVTPVELITNGGYESGRTGWTATNKNVVTRDATYAAHGGLWKAWLNGYGSANTEYVFQSVSIPSATTTTATLKFWLRVDSDETSTTQAWDTLKVEIRNSSNAVLATLATYSNLNESSSYSLHSFDVSAYKGQTIRVYFQGTEGSQTQTSFLIDDVSLVTQ